MKNINLATLRLFNSIQIKTKTPHLQSEALLSRTLRNGYSLDEYISPSEHYGNLLKDIESVVGLSGEKANSSFHKSWKVVRDSSNEQLVLQQIIHYITTYGFEALGVYDSSLVYIPNEVLDLPDNISIPVTVIHGLTKDEILERVLALGSSGVALSERTLCDIMEIVEFNKYDPDFIDAIKNRELRTRLADFYGLVPTDPQEFLRYVISKLTDESLIIKNDELIEKIKASNGKFLDELMQSAPDNLAEIFFRFKPLFLAMKSISRNKTFYNRLRKQANSLHKPKKPDFLNSVTAQIKSGNPQLSKLEKSLDGASLFRKVRLLNALNYRLHNPTSIVYRVRNGKGWAEEFEWAGSKRHVVDAMTIVGNSITENANIAGKAFYIPRGVEYPLPSSEKQFVGNLPFGTSFEADDNLVVGVYWENTGRRIDLDFSAISLGGKIGWDSAYRTNNREVMFSGDMTDAENGASELYYFGSGAKNPYSMNLNYYNFDANDPINFKLFAAAHKANHVKRGYAVDPNDVVASANMTIDKKQMVVGLAYEKTLYLYSVAAGGKISSRVTDVAKHSLNHMLTSLVHSVKLSKMLAAAGADVFRYKPTDREFIDLSPESLDKTTILKIFS